MTPATTQADDELDKLLSFLEGYSDYDGRWFGDTPEGAVGAFWWRKHLRKAIEAERRKHLLDLIGPNEPVDGYSKDPNRSVRPAARNEVRDELRAKIEAWAGGVA